MIGLKLVSALIIFSIVYVFQLYFNRSLILKILSISIMFAISSLVYFSFETYKGWPTREKITKGYLIDAEVLQPDSHQNFPGAIFVWVVSQNKELAWYEKLFTYQYEITPAPRSYYLPYSKNGDKKFSDAKKKLKDGYVIEITDGSEMGEQQDGKNGKKAKQLNNSGDSSVDYDVPNLLIISPDNMLHKSDE